VAEVDPTVQPVRQSFYAFLFLAVFTVLLLIIFYSIKAKGGWGFSADLGLLALNPASAVRFGRSLGAGQSLEDTLREMRLSPVLQLGASYSF